MHTKYLVVIAAVLALAGCSTVVNQSVAFNAADLSGYEAPGSAVIRGFAFVLTNDGGKKTTHNADRMAVYLMPLTPYTDERAAIMLSQKG